MTCLFPPFPTLVLTLFVIEVILSRLYLHSPLLISFQRFQRWQSCSKQNCLLISTPHFCPLAQCHIWSTLDRPGRSLLVLLYNKCPLSLFIMCPAVIITYCDLSGCLQASVTLNSLCAFCPQAGEQGAITETHRKRERGHIERASVAAVNMSFFILYRSSTWCFF